MSDKNGTGITYLYIYILYFTLFSVKNTGGGSSEAAMMETTFGIFVIRKEGAEPDVGPEDVGIVLEGVQVLDELGIILHQLHQVKCLVCTILPGNKLDSDSDSETYHILWSCCLCLYMLLTSATRHS